jgi:hypothetical protein
LRVLSFAELVRVATASGIAAPEASVINPRSDDVDCASAVHGSTLSAQIKMIR